MSKIKFHHIKLIARQYGLDINVYNAKLDLFIQAMTHHSCSPENYERLEYLGDSIFHLIVCEYIYQRYPDEDGGFLTRLMIRLEKSDSMIEMSKILGLDKFFVCRVAKQEKHYEDIFEAFIAAWYLNYGITATKKLIISILERHKDFAELIHYNDNYKDILLRYFHKQSWGEPEYHITDRVIIRDINDEIIGLCMIEDDVKKAEQMASKQALEKLDVFEVEKESNKSDKGPRDIYNEKNKLLKITDIRNIFAAYNVKITTKIVAKDIKLFKQAMTHKSYMQRRARTDGDKLRMKNSVPLQKYNNERLTFLGSAVYHFIIAEYLFHQYNDSENLLTQLRSCLESKKVKYHLAHKSQVASFVLISHGIESTHGRQNLNIFGRGFSAFLGVSYLLFGWSIVQRFLLEMVRCEINMEQLIKSEINYRNLAISKFKHHGCYPTFKVIETTGPDHKQKFTVGMYLNDKLLAKGRSSSKKKAMQLASKKFCKNQGMI